MTTLRRLVDWAVHGRPREVAAAATVLVLCVAAVVGAAVTNSRDAGPVAGVPPVPSVADVAVPPPGTTTAEARRAAVVAKRKKAARQRSRAVARKRQRRARGGRRHDARSLTRSKKGADGVTGRNPVAASAGPRAPVVIGADVQNGGAVDRFFRQYDVDAASSDGEAAIRATAAWVNAHGGIAGRPVTLRVRRFDFYGSPVSVQDEATCASWAGGDRPVAAIDAHASTDILIPCLRKHGIATLVNTTTPPTSKDFADAGGMLVAPGSPALDRVQSAYVDGLRQAGFFDKGARIGLLLSENLPQLSAGAGALQRALAAANLPIRATARISLEDPASFFATEASAVLRFRLAKVDRIVALDQDGLALGQFMRGAEAESYRPLYGISSADAPAFLAAASSPRQLRGAIGIGWSPLLDVQAADDPGGGTRAHCSAIFSGAGVAVGGRTPFGQFAAYQACDSLLALRAARATTTQRLRSGMAGLGTSWASGLTLATRLDAGRRDGASGWRLLRYVATCRCFRYDGPTHPM